MPPSETGKQRAARIPLDYFRHSNRMEAWKGRLALLALLVGGGAVVAAILLPLRGKGLVSRGPVARVHQAWNNRCEVCHADFAPMSKSNATVAFLTKQPGDRDFPNNVRCERCHSGVDHHESQLAALTPSCGGCHRDHQGLVAQLTRVPDADCTPCHANLAASTKENKVASADNVTSFAANHPEFRSLKGPDPGKLK
ncbi:MAG: hypothetical protein ACRD36_10545, partial [Candidatus Acidiferrum sp.]